MSTAVVQGSGGPPTFEESRNRRQRARSAGMNPNYWYVVEVSKDLKKGQVTEVTFWKQSLALYRDVNGQVFAIENRCAHRQLKLTLGEVKGCHLVCPYHGWEYNGEGRVKYIPHELFGRDMPRFKVKHYPVVERYGFVWLFPGDRDRADSTPIPEIPELEGKDRWAFLHLKYDLDSHHSMIIDNVCDFTHEYLHRKTKPFSGAKMTSLKADENSVSLSYDTKIGAAKLMQIFVNEDEVNQNKIDLCYEYPYQWSNTDDKIKHWMFSLPIDEQRTKVFFVFYFKSIKMPLLPFHLPRWLHEGVMRTIKHLIFDPILGEDAWAVAAEQAGYNEHYDAPIAEINPAVKEFQDLTIRKWVEHLEQQKISKKRRKRTSPTEAVEVSEPPVSSAS